MLSDFLAPQQTAALRGECARRRVAGEFRAARVGRGAALQRDAGIRGDQICWLDADSASAPERETARAARSAGASP